MAQAGAWCLHELVDHPTTRGLLVQVGQPTSRLTAPLVHIVLVFLRPQRLRSLVLGPLLTRTEHVHDAHIGVHAEARLVPPLGHRADGQARISAAS